MRTTLHAVRAADYPALHQALQPTLRGWLRHPYFAATGLSTAHADAVLPDLVAYTAQPRSSREIEAWLGERLGVDGTGVWWALRRFGPFHHTPSGGPWSFAATPAYTAATPVSLSPPDQSDRALQAVVVQYLEGFGPASVADVAQFTAVLQTRVRAALRGLGDAIERLDAADGMTLFDVPGGSRPAGDLPVPPRLMAMWDSTLLAYADRSRVLPDRYRPHVIRSNGNVLPTLLVDGYVAGVWRLTNRGVDALAFHHLPDRTWQALTREAATLTAFLAGRDPGPYRGSERWWADLPNREVRTLA